MDKSIDKFKSLLISLEINQRLFREIISELKDEKIGKQFQLILTDNERVVNELRNEFRLKTNFTVNPNPNRIKHSVVNNDNKQTDNENESQKPFKPFVSTTEPNNGPNSESQTSGSIEYRCQWPGCGYGSQFSANMSRHLCVHSGQRRYVCDWPQCMKRYKQSSALLAHKRSHLGLKPFACDWIGCDYRTNNRCSLPAHKRTHKGFKPFACDWDNCSVCCSTITHLREHQLIHTKEKYFKCDVCLQSFAKKSNMRAHKRSVHLGLKRIRNKTHIDIDSKQSND